MKKSEIFQKSDAQKPLATSVDDSPARALASKDLDLPQSAKDPLVNQWSLESQSFQNSQASQIFSPQLPNLDPIANTNSIPPTESGSFKSILSKILTTIHNLFFRGPNLVMKQGSHRDLDRDQFEKLDWKYLQK